MEEKISQLQKRIEDLEAQVVQLRSLVVNPVLVPQYYPPVSPPPVAQPYDPYRWVPQQPLWGSSGMMYVSPPDDSQVWLTGSESKGELTTTFGGTVVNTHKVY